MKPVDGDFKDFELDKWYHTQTFDDQTNWLDQFISDVDFTCKREASKKLSQDEEKRRKREAFKKLFDEEVKPPSFEQAQVAQALMRRTRTILGEPAFNEFTDVQFLICVPAFTTLQAQTAYRVRKAGLLDRERNEDEYSKVVMQRYDGTSVVTFNAFKKKAIDEQKTLFVIIADVCARHTIAGCLCILGGALGLGRLPASRLWIMCIYQVCRV